MKLLSFYRDNEVRLGILTTTGLVDVQEAVQKYGINAPHRMMDVIREGSEALDKLRRICAVAKNTVKDDEVRYAPAVLEPGKILCVGTNYRRHAIESNLPIPDAPVYFSKYANSLAGHAQDVMIPAVTQQCDYEVELVTVIGRRARRVRSDEALQYVFGYAVGNDLSARDLQFRTSQWLFGKAIDGFAPLGPYLVTADEVPDPQRLHLKCWVNGELRQNSNTEDMIFSVAELISDLSQVMTLEPGDVIYTGTPEGVGLGMEPKRWLRPGDEIACEIDGLGRLVNRLVAEDGCS